MADGDDIHWMTLALVQAERARDCGEVPVGAVVVADGELIGAGYNHPIASHDPTCHAEIHALREAAARRQNYRLPGTTLYVTIEPCTMCLGALIHARVSRLVFGSREPRAGAVASNSHILESTRYNHHIEWSEGVLAAECSQLISDFFRARREAAKSPVGPD